MKQYQVIQIVNEEPLKIGAGGNKISRTEPSKDYIPGSTIRGGLIAQMLRLGVCKEENLVPVLQHMECYNAYPYQNQCLYIPTPQHLRINKHDWRLRKIQQSQPAVLSDLTQGGIDKNTLDFRYVAIRGDVLQGIQVSKAYQLHQSQSLNKDRQEKENLFSYQAIEPGYTFRAIVAFDSSIESEVRAVLKRIDRWYLGGSKGTGYGLCRVSRIAEPTTDYEQAKRLVGLTAGMLPSSDKLVVSCLSDCLVRNEYGQPINIIPAELITELCGLSVELEQQYVQAGISEGYNAKWQARYPKEATLKAGSTFVYSFTEHIDNERMDQIKAKLEHKLIGFRTQDGFGWIGVNIHYPTELMVYSGLDREDGAREQAGSGLWHADDCPSPDTLDPADKEVILVINKGLSFTRKRWLQLLCERSWDEAISQESGDSYWISRDLNVHHYENMRGIIDGWLETPKAGCLKRLLGRDYEEDRHKCSIAGCNFKQIVRYLDEDHESEECRPIATYAEHKLRSRKGELYYGDVTSRDARKTFIAELLSNGLYMRARRAAQ